MSSPTKPRCKRDFLPEISHDLGLKPGSSVRSRWHDVEGWKIHERYIEGRNSGIPVVFIHGLVISSLYFVPLARCLSHDFDVRMPDQPGFGRSEGPMPAPNVVEMADWLIRWLDAVGIER